MANVCCVQVPCKAVDLEDAIWLDSVPEELVEGRYLHFREHEGRVCSVADSLKAWARGDKLLELPWHPKLTQILKVRPQCEHTWDFTPKLLVRLQPAGILLQSRIV